MQRLGKNIGGYFGDRIKLVDVVSQVEVAAAAHGWQTKDYLRTSSLRLFALRRPALVSDGSHTARRTYISSGIHGDEPAGPLAVLRLLQEDKWPGDCDLWLCPCLNPAGFVLNQRENDKGIDLNRDYLHLKTDEVRAHVAWLERQPGFDLCLLLHEDWESHGFYVYEQNPDNKPSVADAIISGVEKVCPIDRSDLIEARPATNGIIRPNIAPRTREDWPEAFYLISHKTRQSYTLEAPSDFPLATRVDALVAAVNAALGA